MCLHLLALWILCSSSPLSIPSMPSLAVEHAKPAKPAEARLLDGLETLRIIGASSIMSLHAHRRLQQYLVLVRLLGAGGDIRTDAGAGVSAGANASAGTHAMATVATTTTRTARTDGLLVLHSMQQHVPPGPVTFLGPPDATNPAIPSLEDLFCQLGDRDLFEKGRPF